MELTKTEKDKRKLVKDRYIYVFKKVPASDISSWQCIFRRKVGQCCATVQISPTDKFAEKGNTQTHAPSPKQVEVIKIKVGMKCKAKTTEETVQQILDEQLSNISENAAETLPSIATMRRNIRKSREDDNISQIPVNREDTPVLPNEYHITKSREQFSCLTAVRRIQKECLSWIQRLAHAFHQSRTTVSLMEHLEFAQKSSFSYILCMHSNMKKFPMHHWFITKEN